MELYLANQTVTILGECNNRGSCAGTLSICDNSGLATFHGSYS